MDCFLVSCEHGGNQIPQAYRAFFSSTDAEVLLATHRGYDAGALLMAEDLAASLPAPLVSSTVSRLLVDLNRSLTHPQVFSVNLQGASAEIKARIVEQHYRPYRDAVEMQVKLGAEQGKRVVHVSCHSFTPVLDGTERNCDIGLLYDPARHPEVGLSKAWQAAIHANNPPLKVRRNYPYAGKNDGLTTALRRRFSADDYVGIELEINQKRIFEQPRFWKDLRVNLVESLLIALKHSDNCKPYRTRLNNRKL